MPRVNKPTRQTVKRVRHATVRRRVGVVRKRQNILSVRFGYGLIALAALAGVLLAYPYVKSWSWSAGEVSSVSPHVINDGSDPTTKQLTDEKRLIIPSIGVDTPIIEGPDESALNKGAWRIPKTSTPDHGGNTVISGHRFKYLPPNNTTFYLLDKLQPGDAIQVQWAAKLYNYRVTGSREVKPEQVEILENTKDDRLTLFTCTPILSTTRRLVVTAELVNIADGT